MLNLLTMAEITGLSITECRNYRIDFLKRHIMERSEDAAWLAGDSGEISACFCQDVIGEIVAESRELRHLVRLTNGYMPRVGSITPEMVEAARLYPIDQIIEFDRHGKALAWCHADKSPSLSWYRAGNKATCFPCSKSFNCIDVLRERDGLTFRDAIKQLTS